MYTYIHNFNTRCCNVIKLILCYLAASLDYTQFKVPNFLLLINYNVSFKLMKTLSVTTVRQGSSLANRGSTLISMVPQKISGTVCLNSVSYRSSCANQPGKPHCVVDNDHCNTSQYQQDVVDKYTTVAPKGSIAKLLGSLIVSRIIVARSLWREVRVLVGHSYNNPKLFTVIFTQHNFLYARSVMNGLIIILLYI